MPYSYMHACGTSIEHLTKFICVRAEVRMSFKLHHSSSLNIRAFMETDNHKQPYKKTFTYASLHAPAQFCLQVSIPLSRLDCLYLPLSHRNWLASRLVSNEEGNLATWWACGCEVVKWCVYGTLVWITLRVQMQRNRNFYYCCTLKLPFLQNPVRAPKTLLALFSSNDKYAGTAFSEIYN